jgi:hypothetical protein
VVHGSSPVDKSLRDKVFGQEHYDLNLRDFIRSES